MAMPSPPLRAVTAWGGALWGTGCRPRVCRPCRHAGLQSPGRAATWCLRTPSAASAWVVSTLPISSSPPGSRELRRPSLQGQIVGRDVTIAPMREPAPMTGPPASSSDRGSKHDGRHHELLSGAKMVPVGGWPDVLVSTTGFHEISCGEVLC